VAEICAVPAISEVMSANANPSLVTVLASIVPRSVLNVTSVPSGASPSVQVTVAVMVMTLSVVWVGVSVCNSVTR
jgi:hypothetical protein